MEITHKDWPDDWAFPATWTALIRISIAELEYDHEAPEPEQPAKKGMLRRLGKG
ncbi:hypothetical protein ACFVEN_00365 [Streptomyces sp. NPDC057681]|uniref:hypothetical protein n=1 Tax=Streptomyces sp. NPDC057681 TaxID=3346209 RepID=UPI0036AA3C8B